MDLRSEFNSFCKDRECVDCPYEKIDCHFKFAFEKGIQVAIEEAKGAVHSIFAGDLHCVEDYCNKDGNDNCEYCFYKAVNESLDLIKDGKHI